MKLHCVFMDGIFIKAFRTYVEADICAMGIQMWLTENNMDIDIVHIKEEVLS